MSGRGPPGRWWTSAPGRLLDRLFVLTGLVAFVGVVYVAVVIVAGRFVGPSHAPSALLSVTATAVVAAGLEPARRTLRGWANRVTGRPHLLPYDALAHFASESGLPISAQQAPARMAKVLAAGVDAASVEVWLLAGGRMRLAAVYPDRDSGPPPAPPEHLAAPAPGRHAREVRHTGDLLGVLVVEEREGERLTPVEEELLDSLATQAGLVLRNLRLTTELQDRLRDVSARAGLLRESRQRLVASEDVERRLLERDIHDGAQQQLVALAVNIRLAQTLLPRRPADAHGLLRGLDRSVQLAAADLLEVVSGRPRLLAETGLATALRAAADSSPLRVELVSRGLGRYPADVELALYFCCLEALQNVAKHAAARAVVLELSDDERGVTACVSDDGRGFDVRGRHEGGLAHMSERIRAVGGALSIRSDHGDGTVVRAEIPVRALGRTS